MKFNVKQTINQTEETMWSKGEKGIRIFSIDREIQKYTNIIQVNNRMIIGMSVGANYNFKDIEQKTLCNEISDKMEDMMTDAINEAKWVIKVLGYVKQSRDNMVVRLIWDYMSGSNKKHKYNKINEIMSEEK